MREKIFLQATQERNVLSFVIFSLLFRCLLTPLFISDLLHATQCSPELPFLRTLDVGSDYTHKDQLSISKPGESGTHTEFIREHHMQIQMVF